MSLIGRTVARRTPARWIAFMLAATSLAACAQSAVVSQRSDWSGDASQTAREHDRASRYAAIEPTSIVTKQHALSGKRFASQGLASFYSEGTRTASGEKFDPGELTAAHPTLPFGTRLRVTNLANGQSVTVRVNDRGPFVAGRVVDVSYSAAKALGMAGAGTANVRLDVVQ